MLLAMERAFELGFQDNPPALSLAGQQTDNNRNYASIGCGLLMLRKNHRRFPTL